MFSLQGLSPYVIAEVGQNHQGDLEEALRYVHVFASMGASAVKFQMRCNKLLFDPSFYDSPYDSENAFAATYGKHREALELDISSFEAIVRACRASQVDFVVTPFDIPSLESCLKLRPDALKLASFDLGNIPFIKRVANTHLPLIMSTGGGSTSQIESSVATVMEFHDDLALLHCVSKYPCPVSDLRLSCIQDLSKQYSSVTIGLSDHFNGILSGPVGLMLGATVFEKHVTFDRSQKGTDHAFSLEPEGFRKFVRDIKRTSLMVAPSPPPEDLGFEPVFKKLGKSIVALCDIKAGTIIDDTMLDGRIVRPTILPVRLSGQVLGAKALVDIKAGQYIDSSMFQR